MDTGKSVLSGIAGGTAGAMAMSVTMQLGQRTGMIKTPPPLMIERRVEERLGVAEKTSPRQEKGIAMASHMMMGMSLGAIYGALRSALNWKPIPSGPLFGLGAYLVNFGGWLPAFNLMPGPWNEEMMTVGRRMMMHLLFGTVTGVVSKQVYDRLEA